LFFLLFQAKEFQMSYRGIATDKADPSDAGCWIDGHWGQYGSQRLITIASTYGFQMAPIDYESEDAFEDIIWEADTAEAWMNENIAPEGYSFGWYDGEWFLQSEEWWNEL
jgi:hypothetical protein